jgi:glycosyltransferase involved in cell wall biosynthesis
VTLSATDTRAREAEIAVLIPCFNEGPTIAKVVAEFRVALPSATIYVYDNNSTDDTVEKARAAGAVVRHEPMQGKGYVMRRMFADVSADVYVMVDGDDTYDVNAAARMVEELLTSGLDFVNGMRISTDVKAYRAGHQFGNWILTRAVARIFGHRVGDMLSGLKVLSRRFVKSFPCLATGFEIETEITVHALELAMPIGERPVSYRERPLGSFSKLHTVRDGIRIAWLIFRLLRAERPTIFFGTIFVFFATISSLLGWEIFTEWRATGLVLRMPTAVLTTGMMVLAFLSAACGIILETVTLGRRESKRMVYLSIPPLSQESAAIRLDVGFDARSAAPVSLP